HYAAALNLPRAQSIIDQWVKDPRTNYHKWVAGFTGLEYKYAKNMNLGLAYGMGLEKMAHTLGLTVDECKPMWDMYHEKMPFIRGLSQKCSDAASSRGWVKTLSGRKRRFNLYGPRKYKAGDKPLAYDEAVKMYGPHVVKWFTYRASNAVVQGSAADILKRAMVTVFKNGLVPLASVHDELLFSLELVNMNSTVRKVKYIMETHTVLKVPTPVDVAVGPSWGEAKEIAT
ncbi:MAG: DNA polymerase, partial [Bacteroidota bacterium]